MLTLGLSFDFHDAAAALVGDQGVIAAAQEERFSRRKNDPQLPRAAVEYCLAQAGASPSDLDDVVFYENSLLKFDRILRHSLVGLPATRNYLAATIRSWINKGKLHVGDRIADELGLPRNRIRFVRHHHSHAASAYFCSPFEAATVVTLDGVGEYESATLSVGQGNRLKRIAALKLPHSIGLFYSAITAFLGFEVNEGEYKVMGMAGFGEPKHYALMRGWFDLRPDGWFRVEQRLFNFTTPVDVPYTSALVEALGPPRQPESPFRLDPRSDAEDERQIVASSRHYADIAASAQKVTEEVILHVVQKAVARTGLRNVCLAGGVALNSLANGRIKNELGLPLYVQPAAGDAGGSLGAALYWRHCVRGQRQRNPLEHAYWGKSCGPPELQAALDKAYCHEQEALTNDEQLFAQVAKLLQQGAVVGWLNGRVEWGPRALGGRSILGNPMLPDMKQIMNEKIKFREPFRPFAPAVLEERAAEFFELGSVHGPTDPLYFMLAICRVRPEKQAILPAITHSDGTARVQLVSKKTNPRFYGLIEAFGRLTGVPVILNTSFNLRGEPIVNTPLDALKTFEWSDMDCLVLENHLIRKSL